MNDCDLKQVGAVADLTFTVCMDHGDVRVDSASLQYHGVGFDHVASGLLTAIEQAVSKEVAELPPVKRALTKDWGLEVGVLREAAQEHIALLIAHQYILAKVAAREYPTYAVSMAFNIPRD